MGPINRLPVEILNDIHHKLMDSAKNDPSPAQAQPCRQYPRLTQAQQARRAAAARANFSVVCKKFHSVDRGNLSLKKNAETGCAATQNAIHNLAPLDKKHFIQRVRSLLQDSQNVAVDFSSLSPEQTHIVLNLLVERAEKGKPLHQLGFYADMDRVSPTLLRRINDTITAIRNTAAGANTAAEFACSSHDENRLTPPNLSKLTNLTSVDFSMCKGMRTTPNFSKNPKLKSANLLGCEAMTVKPDFSNNPELESVNLGWCKGLTDLDFSKNAKLVWANLHGCVTMTRAPNFSNNPALKWIDFSFCEVMSIAPDFSNNPALEWVDLSECPELTEAPVFSKEYLPKRVDLSESNLATATLDELRELLGDRLIL